jgi:hypothetical protein
MNEENDCKEKESINHLLRIDRNVFTLRSIRSKNKSLNFDFQCKHLNPDDFFKKLPKFGKINFGTAKVPNLVQWLRMSISQRIEVNQKYLENVLPVSLKNYFF